METYDVVIVGASFAGLAVASQLRGQRVLLIDTKPIGSGQTSACGTIYQVLRHWRAEEAVLHIHHGLTLHTGRGASYPFPSPYPWCTLDYRKFCQLIFRKSQAEFLQTRVSGFDGKTVFTSKGAVSGRVFVDASGWRAVLASSLQPDYPVTQGANFGIETISAWNPAQANPDELHFWYDPAVLPGGIGWVFPHGTNASIGVGMYTQATQLRQPLKSFVSVMEGHTDGIHGTYFPYRLRLPVVENLFVVGDAAGMCLGLTGEGIRPALYFGEQCGKIIHQICASKISLGSGLTAYRKFVASYTHFYRLFSWAQEFFTAWPPSWIGPLAGILNRRLLRLWVLKKYWNFTRAWNN